MAAARFAQGRYHLNPVPSERSPAARIPDQPVLLGQGARRAGQAAVTPGHEHIVQAALPGTIAMVPPTVVAEERVESPRPVRVPRLETQTSITRIVEVAEIVVRRRRPNKQG